MPLSKGTKLGTYEIVGVLGVGGMGEVYRAHDSKLKREVAIKVLPEAFARDAVRLSRFQREAEVLASLNHPHIAAIYDIADFEGSRFLVLELVEGETLADRIARGPIPLNEALPIARQIAEAVEAAHEKGVIHRDLKPANIKRTSDGNVKVLDFGLAKILEPQGGAAALSNSPTLMTADSIPGAIMGTAAYMSPEQAKGQDADRASDVWAFGCVLYEMLTGFCVFEGETLGEILGGVFKSEPDWRRLPAETPEGIRRLLRRCLQKEEKLRLRDIREARIEIDGALSSPTPDVHVAGTGSRRRERFAWVTALAVVTAIAAVAILWAVRPAEPAPEMRVEITTPPTARPTNMAISPDGQKIVFVANDSGQPKLWLRSLDSVSPRPLTGTDGLPRYPFWSPDSRSIGFFAERKLKRVDIEDGSVQALADAPGYQGGAWNRDGTILFSPSTGSGPIYSISAAGGEPTAVTELKARQALHSFPQFLPDGRHFLYYVTGSPEARGVYVGQLDGSQTLRLLDADEDAAAVYASSGQLLFTRQGKLFAQNFDPARLELSGDPYLVAEQVAVDQNQSAALSTSAAGHIAYRTGSGGSQRQLTWVDRSGNEIGKVGGGVDATPLNPSLSPDGRLVALARTVNGNSDIWLLETARGVLRGRAKITWQYPLP